MVVRPDRARSSHIAISRGLEEARSTLLTLAVDPAQDLLMGGAGGGPSGVGLGGMGSGGMGGQVTMKFEHTEGRQARAV